MIRDLNHYRAPTRFWERIESNPFAQALCLAAVVAAQLR